MRKDENGEECPATIGEYLDICKAISPLSKAVVFLNEKIENDPKGRDSIVLAPDSQMRALLMPMLTDLII